MISLSASPQRVALVLSGILAFLLLAHGVGLIMTYGFGHGRIFGLVRLFNIAVEQNVPTLFATLLLLGSGLLFLALFRVDRPSSRPRYAWLILSLVFCFLAVDEFAVIHERLITPVRQGLDVDGYLFFAWVIPYAAGVALLACAVARTIWQLGWRYRLLFGAAAVAYLGGAIGVEMLGASYSEQNLEQVDLTYRLLQTLEEILEFCGLIVLVYTLMHLLQGRSDGVTVRFS